MYKGSPYVQSGNSLQPVEPAYRTNRNGKIVNAPLTSANWLPHGPKQNNSFNVSAHPLAKVNYSAGSWATVPTPNTVISNANAAEIFKQINAGKIGVPNVPLSNLGMKKVNNALAIPISSLQGISREIIQGTTLLHNLRPSLTNLFNRLKANRNLVTSLRTNTTKNLPKNMTAVNTYVNNLETCPAVNKMKQFLNALPVQVSATSTFLNFNMNSNLNWSKVAQNSGLSLSEVNFFRGIVNDKALMTSLNRTIFANPNRINKNNSKNRREYFAYVIGGFLTLITSDYAAMAAARMFGGPAGLVVAGAGVLASGVGAGTAAAAGGAGTAAVAGVVTRRILTRAAVKAGGLALAPGLA
jgi:hypothetical protein